jgi:hypothetical protein
LARRGESNSRFISLLSSIVSIRQPLKRIGHGLSLHCDGAGNHVVVVLEAGGDVDQVRQIFRLHSAVLQMLQQMLFKRTSVLCRI